ncbi:SGNH/GDSL hydrolase family protein [Empedobacter brevis]|uniref:Esterase n=1 Tax=Empedobacter brevis NBRC 14943 = ATCC 43319 TaxID=1218108 RepID=A0A511NFY8_9FLAO|nr:SGNH/GDSL hydrolase family protein [Empedobacter brevis]GEM51734.1 esterase [Empedobacter brevis NBRC 14943 = ATCC 43319]
MTNCLFFGDSITYGEYDGILGGYVDILKRYCHAEFYQNNTNEINCFNLGIGGETTEGLIKRFEIEVQARYSPDENLIFFLYGANDLAEKNNVELVSLSDFEANLSQMISHAKEFTKHVYLISILPISKTVDGINVPERKFRTTQKIELYNQKLKELAAQNDIEFIDIFSSFNANKEVFLSKDGVHPNEKGYDFIATQIKPILEKYL